MQIVSRSIILTTFVALAVGSSGCTRSQKNVEVAKREAPAISSNPNLSPGVQNNTASAVANLDLKGLVTRTRATETFSYKFEYLDYKDEKNLTIVDDKAKIELTNLPAEKTGEVKLQILRDGVVLAEGKTSGVTLKANQANAIDIKLEKVTPGTIVGSGTTNATISVSIPGIGPSPSPSPVLQPTASPVPVASNTPTPTSWDGLADRGNEKWKIETVTQ